MPTDGRSGTIGVVGRARRARDRAPSTWSQPRRNSGIGACASVLKRAAGTRCWRAAGTAAMAFWNSRIRRAADAGAGIVRDRRRLGIGTSGTRRSMDGIYIWPDPPPGLQAAVRKPRLRHRALVTFPYSLPIINWKKGSKKEREDKKGPVCGSTRQSMWLHTTEGMWLHTTEMDISKCHQGNKGGLSSRPLNHDKARALQSVQHSALHVTAYT